MQERKNMFSVAMYGCAYAARVQTKQQRRTMQKHCESLKTKASQVRVVKQHNGVARREVPHTPPSHGERLAEAVDRDGALPHACARIHGETNHTDR